MRFSTAIVGLLSATVAPTRTFNIFADAKQSVLSDDDLKIPGDSPLEYCEADHQDDILTIKEVVLAPNPPQAGHDLIIQAKGEISKDIEDGAYILLTVKYGLIKLISTTADLCEQIANVELECPVKKGELEIEKVVSLPGEIPPGKYTVFADVYTKDDEPVTCLKATVVFSIGANILNLEL